MVEMNYQLPSGLKSINFPDGATWYTYNGQYLKSVSKILNTVWPLPEIDKFYLERGKLVHAATVLIDQGVLDWEALDSRLIPFCRAYQTFIEMSHPVIEASELIVVATDFSYGGRLDRVLRLPGRDRLLVTDIKTGAGKEPRYQLQLAAYALALAGARAFEYDLAILGLHKNGQPRLTVLENPGFLLEEWRILLANYLKGTAA